MPVMPIRSILRLTGSSNNRQVLRVAPVKPLEPQLSRGDILEIACSRVGEVIASREAGHRPEQPGATSTAHQGSAKENTKRVNYVEREIGEYESIPPKDRIHYHAIIVFQVTLNVSLSDYAGKRMVTALAERFAAIYHRSITRIFVSIEEAPISFGNTHEPTYLLSISGIHTVMDATTNSHYATEVQRAMSDIFHIPLHRGIIKYDSLRENRLVMSGKTVENHIEDLAKAERDSWPSPWTAPIDNLVQSISERIKTLRSFTRLPKRRGRRTPPRMASVPETILEVPEEEEAQEREGAEGELLRTINKNAGTTPAPSESDAVKNLQSIKEFFSITH